MAEVAPEVLMNSILGNINDVLLNGDGETIPRSDDHYLAFMSPGIPFLGESFDYAIEGFGGVTRKNTDIEKLDKSVGPQKEENNDEGDEESNGNESVDPGELAADARRKYQNAEAFAALCDLVPDTSGIVDSGRINVWQPETRVSHAYALALQFSQVYNVEPDAETKRKIDRWRSLLQTTTTEKDLVTEEEVEVIRESEMVKKYREKMLAYYGEALAYNTLRISALAGQDERAVHEFAVNGPIMQMKVRAAENDWISNGYRDDYDRINAAIAAVEGRSFALLKQRYKEDFFRSILTSPSSGANFLYTAPIPADFSRAGSGWSKFEFNSGSYNSNHSFSSESHSGGGFLSLGGAYFGGSRGKRKYHSETKIDTKHFKLTFEICRVPIYRPGINLAFVKSGFWRFDQQNQEYKNTLLSDGKTPPNGIMPAISTDCIFVRNLYLHFGESHRQFRKDYESSGGGLAFGWGSFFFGGRSNSSSGESSADVEWDGQGLRIDGLQLIGFLCHTLDKCPDPNPNVTDWI